MGGVHSVAYDGHLYLVCAACDVTFWRHIHVSEQRFSEVCWQNMHILLHSLSFFYVCHCTEYILSTLQVRISEENKINATTQQLITAKISGCARKPGSKTHSSLRQTNSRCKMRLRWCLVEYEQSSIESVRLDMLVHIPVCKVESC